jgi:hypothetical protein
MFGALHQISVGMIRGVDVSVTCKLSYMQAVRNTFTIICGKPAAKENPLESPVDRLCGLVVRVPGYRSRGPGIDSRRYQISEK